MMSEETKPRAVEMFEIDRDIRAKLEQIGAERGLTLHEVMRCALGRYASDMMTFAPVRRLSVPSPMSPLLFPSSGNDDVDGAARMLANVMSASGAAKCSSCTKKLSSDDILSGKCSECGARQ